MYEVELKLRAAHDPVRERLAAAGATPLGRRRQVDTYYDAPHRDFAATDEALRIREERALDGDGATTELTYKGPLVDETSKTREEHETAVADGAALSAVLRALGFTPAATVEKERERYRLDGYTVTLDDVADLGEFLEVETAVPDPEDGPPDLDPAREGARDLLRELELDPGAGIRESYLGMLLDGGGETPASDSHE